MLLTDFHPTANNVTLLDQILVQGKKGDLTFPVEAPGDITRVRFGLSGRVHDKNDAWTFSISTDDGKSFRRIDTLQGPARFASKWVTASDVPPGTRKVLVRYEGANAAVAMIFNLRVDVDYREPQGGFAPVKITYVWDENGQEKQSVHVASKPAEVYTITCGAKPTMKFLSLERAD